MSLGPQHQLADRGSRRARDTSFSRWELDELAEPTTSMASTVGAIRLTASWRLVVA